MKNKNSTAHQISNELIKFSLSLADKAGPVALSYFRTTLVVEHKEDTSPVTVADRNVESSMREMIATSYPQHGVLGEEHGTANIDRFNTWVLDPIDGTKSFITGSPLFGTLIALLENEIPVIGVIDMPAMGERWLGVKGQASLFNNTPCLTSNCKSLALANLYSTSVDAFDATELVVFNRVSEQAVLRRFGGDCYNYGLLALGHVDVVMESSLEPYDYLALVNIIEGAGGIITDWNGQSLNINSDGRVLACATAQLHAQILNIIAQSDTTSSRLTIM